MCFFHHLVDFAHHMGRLSASVRLVSRVSIQVLDCTAVYITQRLPGVDLQMSTIEILAELKWTRVLFRLSLHILLLSILNKRETPLKSNFHPLFMRFSSQTSFAPWTMLTNSGGVIQHLRLPFSSEQSSIQQRCVGIATEQTVALFIFFLLLITIIIRRLKLFGFQVFHFVAIICVILPQLTTRWPISESIWSYFLRGLFR